MPQMYSSAMVPGIMKVPVRLWSTPLPVVRQPLSHACLFVEGP